MKMSEYLKVKDMNYEEYCDYLQNKYGVGNQNYFTESWVKNTKCTRTKEGLICHHKCEDKAIMLSTPEFAKRNPFDYQLAKNLVYCDYLEHLLLHIFICENPSPDRNILEAVGVGGVINFLVPELNDLYSGWKTNQGWRATCHQKVIDDKDVYLALLKRFKTNCKNYPFYTDDCLYTCFNEKFGLWSKDKNKELFNEIKSL